MTKLPVDGYLEDAARTEAEMKTTFRDIRDVIVELGGGYTGDGIESIQLDTGTLGVPSSQFVKVEPETGSEDTIDDITATDIPDGRIIYLIADDPDDTITVANEDTKIRTANNEAFDITASRSICLVRRATYWEEVARFFDGDHAAMRSWLGLGTASLSAATDFVKLATTGSTQAVADPMTMVDALGLLQSSASGTTQVNMKLNSIERGRITLDGGSGGGTTYIENLVSGAQQTGIRLLNDAGTQADSRAQVRNHAGDSWQEIASYDTTNRRVLDSDKLGGSSLATVLGAHVGTAVVQILDTGDLAADNHGMLELSDGTNSLLVKWGSGTIQSGESSLTITYDTTEVFAIAPIVFLQSMSGEVDDPKVELALTTSFRARRGSSGSPGSFNWLAIGPK